MPLTPDEQSSLDEYKRELKSLKSDKCELEATLKKVVVKTAVRQALDQIIYRIRQVESEIRKLESKK